MRVCRYYLGACLIIVARVAMQAAKAVNWLGMAVMPNTGTKAPQRRSQGHAWHLVPYTVQTRNGQRTLYALERR
jgi:hypothetical protein